MIIVKILVLNHIKLHKFINCSINVKKLMYLQLELCSFVCVYEDHHFLMQNFQINNIVI